MVDRLKQARRIVVKVGTSLITHPGGRLHLAGMDRLVRQLSDLASSGRDVILVSSGAIGAGLGVMRFTERPATLPEKQALAAIGQGVLMHTYEKLFGEYGLTVAQILLTKDDLEHPERNANARATIDTLLGWKVLPIVNENDTVATDEIRVGDNDNLAAAVAVLADADLLILLSDVAGFYRQDPRENADQQPIPLIHEITPDLLAAAGGPGSAHSIGGMLTKLQAAETCLRYGIQVVLADGRQPGVLAAIVSGRVEGTLFTPKEVAR